ncbi:MAG TPA: type II toxin-antitoxin system RelE/ParE family toxin [Pseudolabrys sp.]|nr:type II toxin-antitoxin system RelE/ParE family toxin [Pseudolabrys sp.]
MKLRFSLRATADIAEIADYLAARNPTAAQRVRASIFDSLKLVVLFPQLGRRQATEGVRKLVTRRYRYLVYYTIDETADEIIILGIRHPSRQPEHSSA